MYIFRRIDPNPHIISMVPDSNQMNARSWVTLVLSILKEGILITAGTIQRLKKKLIDKKRTMILLIMQWMKSYYKKILK